MLAAVAFWYGRDLGAEVRLLERDGVQVVAEITGKAQHVPVRTDKDGARWDGVPTYTLTYRFADPGTGAMAEGHATVGKETWEAMAEGDRVAAVVVPGQPEGAALFGTAGLGRASVQLRGLALWLGLAGLACLALDTGLRRRGQS